MLTLNASPNLTQQEWHSRNRDTGHVCNLPGGRRVADARPEGLAPKLGVLCLHMCNGRESLCTQSRAEETISLYE